MVYLSFLNDIFGTGRDFDGVAIPNLFGTGRDIYWYGIIIAFGVLVAFLLAQYDVKRRGLPKDTATDMVIWALIPAVIFARLYYVIFDPNHSFTSFMDIIDISKGGLAIYGGVIGGAIGIFAYSKYKKIKFTTLLDIAAPCLAIGQAFGRWGNFMNQEAFGNPVTDPGMQWFPYAVYFPNPKGGFDAGWFQATFFYESMWCLLICVFILICRKRQRFSGELALWYFLLYGIERTFVELLRQDQLILMDTGIPVSSLLSAVLVFASAVLLILGFLQFKKGKLTPATPGSIYYVPAIDSDNTKAENVSETCDEQIQETTAPEGNEQNANGEQNAEPDEDSQHV